MPVHTGPVLGGVLGAAAVLPGPYRWGGAAVYAGAGRPCGADLVVRRCAGGGVVLLRFCAVLVGAVVLHTRTWCKMRAFASGS